MSALNYGKVLSITAAAPGWFSVYVCEDGMIGKVPVACWGVVEWKGEGDDTVIVSLNAEQGSYELVYSEDTDFLGYTYPGDTTDWEARAEEYLKEQEKKKAKR